MKRLFFIFFLVFGCTDTVGEQTGECGPNESLNPISGTCELIRANNANNLNNQNTANNLNNENNANNMGCEDCLVEFEPGSVSFQYTPVLEAGTANILLKNNVEGDIAVNRIEWEGATAGEFMLDGIDEDDTIESFGSRSTTVFFSPQDLVDDVVTLRVFFDAVPDPAVLEIDTTLMGADVCSENCPRVQVSPPAVQISYQPNSPPVQQTIVVGSVGQANLEVREILLVQQGAAYTLTHDALPIDLRPQATTNLDLVFDTSSPAATGQILIRTNDPFTPEVVVPLDASAKIANNEPCIVVSPTSLDFGTVVRGAVVVQNFNITNCGTVGLNVTSIDRGSFFLIPTPQSFQLTGWTNGMLAAGDTQMVEVTYAPRRAGFDNGSFIVRNTSVDSPAVTVNVRATAEAPPLVDQDIHINVEWDSDDTDVDTHVLLLPGQGLFCDNDCNFSNPEPDWGVAGDWEDDPFLDRDDVDGFGPENVNIEKGIDGMIYRVVLHYWRDSFDGSFSSDSDVTVRLYIRGVLTQTWGPMNLGSTGDTKDVFEIAWPSQAITTFNDPLYSVPSSTSCRPTP